MQTIELTVSGQDLAFSVDVEPDYDSGAPWENSDGHGPVSGWETREKRPGELLLIRDGALSRYYDFAEACRIAMRDGWDSAPYNAGTETKRQQAAKAARADYEYLRAWCNDEWRYVVLTVTLLDSDGNETEIFSSLGMVEDSDSDYLRETAREMADELAGGYGVSWDSVEKETYEYIPRG